MADALYNRNGSCRQSVPTRIGAAGNMTSLKQVSAGKLRRKSKNMRYLRFRWHAYSASPQNKFFLSYLLSHGEIPIPNLLAWAANFLKVKSLPVAKSNKNLPTRFCRRKRLHEIARRCFVDTLRPSIATHISDLIHAHRAAGRTVILMSGSLSFLVQPFHEHFQNRFDGFRTNWKWLMGD